MASTNEPAPSAWLGEVAEILDDIPLPWAVAGAVAAALYRSDPRFTTDLDLLTEWHPELPARLRDRGYDVREVADTGEHPHLLMLRRGSERIDLLLCTMDYQFLALDRSATSNRYLTVEDVLIHKLIANRHKDRSDIESILAAGHELDTGYLDHWVRAWGIADSWADAWP